MIATTRWTLSEGGSHLRQDTTPVRANGENDINIIEYVRVSGTSTSLLGVWKPISTRSGAADLFTMMLKDGELSVFYPKYGAVVYTVRLDRKHYPLTRPNALPGVTTAAESIDVRSLRHTTFQGDKPSLETSMSVSPDGNTMTVTTRTPDSSDEPSVFVYERQR